MVDRPNRDEPESMARTRPYPHDLFSWFLVAWSVVVVIAVFSSIDDQILGPKPGDDTVVSLLVAVAFFALLIQGIGLLIYPPRFARGMDAVIRYWPRRFGFVEICAGLSGVMYEVGRAIDTAITHIIDSGTFTMIIFGFAGVIWMLRVLAKRQIQD